MNKTFRLYGIIFIFVMVVLALLEFNKTEVTDWCKNYDVNEKTAFGLFVFNKEADALLHKKIKRSSLLPYEYFKDGKQQPKNYLLIQTETDLESWKKILQQVSEGSDAMVISESFHPKLQDTLKFYQSYINYGDENLLLLTDKKFKNDSLKLDKLPSGKGFVSIKKHHEILGKTIDSNDGTKANFIKINLGKGHLYLHSEPLFITNYYLLKKGNEKYAEDVFSYLPNRETVWFTGENMVESGSPMRFILSKPALKYAWWLLLGGLLLFVIFNAKRKQRIVPIVEPLKNKSVEFVKSIGNLYLQEGDFHDMMAKKAQFFLNRVRMDLMIETQTLDEKFAHKLQLKTGKSLDKINEAITLIKKGQDPYASVMKEDLIKMNKLLDEILM